MSGQEWICPKCGRVWGPLVMQCAPCNQKPVLTSHVPYPSIRGGAS